MAKTVRTSLDLCGTPDCWHEDCVVDMRVCECGAGPLNDSEHACPACAMRAK